MKCILTSNVYPLALRVESMIALLWPHLLDEVKVTVVVVEVIKVVVVKWDEAMGLGSALVVGL